MSSRAESLEPLNVVPASLEMRGPSLYLMIVVLMLVQIFDGVGMLSLTFVGSLISRQFALTSSQLGACIGITFLGMAIGAMLFGWVAGRLGQKRTLVRLIVMIGLSMLATSWAGGVVSLFVIRFIMGLALGGVYPIAAAMLIEKSPPALRTTAVSLMTVGTACGAIACGLLASFVVPNFGWRSMFVATAMLSVILFPALIWAIPNGSARVSNGSMPGVTPPAGAQSTIFGNLLPVTALLWCTLFFCALPVYFAVGWLPTLAKAAGATSAQAAFGASLFTSVGALGGVLASRLVDRFGMRITPLLTLSAAVSMVLLGNAIGSNLLSMASAVGGLLVMGLHVLTGALSGQVYPSGIRAFGVGCGSAVLRLGASIGPWIGGVALDAGFHNKLLFVIAGGLVIVGGASLWVLGRTSEPLRESLSRVR